MNMVGIEIVCPNCKKIVRQQYSSEQHIICCKCNTVGTDGFLFKITRKQAFESGETINQTH